MAGGAQAKMSTWFSKPNQSLILKVTKKRVGFNLKIFVFALLKTVHCRAERNPGRIGRLFNCSDTALRVAESIIAEKVIIFAFRQVWFVSWIWLQNSSPGSVVFSHPIWTQIWTYGLLFSRSQMISSFFKKKLVSVFSWKLVKLLFTCLWFRRREKESIKLLIVSLPSGKI